VIVAVPERSIGQSFASTDLTSHGFFAAWPVAPANNLCTPGSDSGKIQAFIRFLENSTDTVLVCTHATLRFAYEKLTAADFNNVLVAIDEFHHVSADLEKSNLGALIHDLLKNSTAHIVAMTGSYFRGDRVPVLSPETEAKFTPVTFNYYDQLNGYRHLKTLGIGHHFYQGTWYDSLPEILDPNKKTILHIPHVGSAESTKDKYEEVNRVLDAIGTVESVDEATGVITVRRKDSGGTLKVADLVDDSDFTRRARILDYLTTVAAKNRDGIDIIIALGMAKEGFDWPYAEHALTVGYRASLTEIIQIIGRVTRDSEGKAHAQFTNLIAQPDDAQDEVTVAVNNVLKAITASLLMEQVLAENFSFKNRAKPGDAPEHSGQLLIEGFKEPTTARTADDADPHDADRRGNAEHAHNEFPDRATAGDARDERAHERGEGPAPAPDEYGPDAIPAVAPHMRRRHRGTGVRPGSHPPHRPEVLTGGLRQNRQQVEGRAGDEHPYNEHDGQNGVDLTDPLHPLLNAQVHADPGENSDSDDDDDADEAPIAQSEGLHQTGGELHGRECERSRQSENSGQNGNDLNRQPDRPASILREHPDYSIPEGHRRFAVVEREC